MHRFDTLPYGTTIVDVRTAFGCAKWPGWGPPNGTPCTVYVWDDPTNNNDPSDCVLLTSEATTVQNVDTDIVNTVPLTTPVAVSGHFYVGVALTYSSGTYLLPADSTTPYVDGNAWFCIESTPGNFDPNDLTNNSTPPYDYGKYFLLRAGF
jgi:hypothetical protein